MLLVDFLDNRLPEFDEDKAKIDRDSTSRLSPYIHFGEVSVCSCKYGSSEGTQCVPSNHEGLDSHTLSHR